MDEQIQPESCATEPPASEHEPKQTWQAPELHILDIEETELGNALNPDGETNS